MELKFYWFKKKLLSTWLFSDFFRYDSPKKHSVVTLTQHIRANTGHLPNAAIEMKHRLQRRLSIYLTLGRCLVLFWDDLLHDFVPDTVNTEHSCGIYTILDQRQRRWAGFFWRVFCVYWELQAFVLWHFLALPTRFTPTAYCIHTMTPQALLTFFSSEWSPVLQSCIVSFGQQ